MSNGHVKLMLQHGSSMSTFHNECILDICPLEQLNSQLRAKNGDNTPLRVHWLLHLLWLKSQIRIVRLGVRSCIEPETLLRGEIVLSKRTCIHGWIEKNRVPMRNNSCLFHGTFTICFHSMKSFLLGHHCSHFIIQRIHTIRIRLSTLNKYGIRQPLHATLETVKQNWHCNSHVFYGLWLWIFGP